MNSNELIFKDRYLLSKLHHNYIFKVHLKKQPLKKEITHLRKKETYFCQYFRRNLVISL